MKVPGLKEALSVRNGNVTSIYSPEYVERHLNAMWHFESGNIIFTFPASPVKCPGAPQKICYITEHFLRRIKKRQNANIFYNTALPVIFGVKYFADALWIVAKQRNVNVNLKTNLVEVHGRKNQAVFANVDNPSERTTVDVGESFLSSEVIKKKRKYFTAINILFELLFFSIQFCMQYRHKVSRKFYSNRNY